MESWVEGKRGLCHVSTPNTKDQSGICARIKGHLIADAAPISMLLFSAR